MSTSTWKPPEIILWMDPVLASFDISKMCMIHITPPNIIPTKWPSDRYFIILRRRNQTKQTVFEWRTMSLQLLFSRNIKMRHQCCNVRKIVARDILIKPHGAYIYPSFRNYQGSLAVSESNFVTKSGSSCKICI